VLIDWFTVCAQALNFLILVWLLHRYLYKPVLAAIASREKKVAATIADATAKEAHTRAADEALGKREATFDREREALLRKASDEAVVERQRLIEAARSDSQQLRVQLADSLNAERLELGRQLSLRTQAEVFALTRKTLSDLAGVGLEDQMTEALIHRLQELPETQRKALVGVTGLLVRSAFDPSAAQRARLQAAVHESLAPQIALRYETAPELVCGIELSADGVKLAWSIADYLATLSRDTASLAALELAHVA
jgi:F-type H+-transporting ATPase subunit b